MSSQVTTLGAGHWWARPRGQSTALYFGTTVTSAKIQSIQNKDDVMNDLGGRLTRFQWVYDGETDQISGVWNRFDWSTWITMREMCRVNAAIPGGTPGVDGRLSRGSLGIGYFDFAMIWIPEFQIAPAHPLINPQAPKGRIYYSCTIGTYSEDSIATRVEDLGCVFIADNLFDPTTRAFGLYSENPADFGTLAPIT